MNCKELEFKKDTSANYWRCPPISRKKFCWRFANFLRLEESTRHVIIRLTKTKRPNSLVKLCVQRDALHAYPIRIYGKNEEYLNNYGIIVAWLYKNTKFVGLMQCPTMYVSVVYEW